MLRVRMKMPSNQYVTLCQDADTGGGVPGVHAPGRFLEVRLS
jgi:hypothetical protein